MMKNKLVYLYNQILKKIKGEKYEYNVLSFSYFNTKCQKNNCKGAYVVHEVFKNGSQQTNLKCDKCGDKITIVQPTEEVEIISQDSILEVLDLTEEKMKIKPPEHFYCIDCCCCTNNSNPFHKPNHRTKPCANSPK